MPASLKIKQQDPMPLRVAGWLFILLLQAVNIPVFSQAHHVQFEQVGVQEGLSESNILCVLQDSRGFMWFGTGDGLYKYDGYSFTPYHHDKKKPASISNNFIQAIAESKNGDLWVATLGGGLCRYDRRKDRFMRFQHDPENSNSIIADDVHSVLEDSGGQVWIGTTEGLDRFDPQKNSFTHFRYDEKNNTSISDNYIRQVFEDHHHDIWIATFSGGLNLFNRQSETFTRFRHKRDDNNSISSDNIYTVFEDSRNNLWIGTNENGLDLFNKEKKQFSHFKYAENNRNGLTSNAVRSIKESNDNKIWIGTENGGISVFDPRKQIFHTYKNDARNNTSLASNSVNTIYKDRKGNMWIGTFNAGINLSDADAGKFRHYKHIPSLNSLSHNKVLCIYEDSKKNIWVGTDGGGLNVFDPRTGYFRYFRHEKNNINSIASDYILSVREDSKGNIWIGTWGDGITVFNPVRQTYRHFKNNIYDSTSLSNNNAWDIFEDKEKNIWVGTYGGGLNKFNAFTQSFTSYQYNEKNDMSISDNWVNSIYEDSGRNLWICTSGGGLNLLDRKTGTFTQFMSGNTGNDISTNNVNSIVEDRNGNLWIATQSGLNLLDKKTNKFSVYTTEDGFPGNMIFGILEDQEGFLWISSDKGLSRFNPSARTIKNYSVADGLQSNRFKEHAYCKTSSGMMYFGGNNGFNQFFPGNIKTIAFDPPLVITNFQVFNKEVPVAIDANDQSPLKESITETKAIVLPYKNSFLSFSFASLNYSSSEKKQYAYMLEGFDKDWNEVGTKHTATYTNLDPGKYVFKVKGLNNEGNWSPAVTSIELTITPPFWLTWWFRIAVLLFAGGMVFIFYLARINAIKSRQKILEQKVKEQTIQLELLNEEERKARREADQANIELEKKNKELEQFVYIASHDLREPLRTTSSFVELFQRQYKGRLDERADQYLSYIIQAADRMKTLINDLLDYSRLGNNAKFKKIDCGLILQEVLADLGIALKEACAEVTASPLPVVTGLPTGIKQLFQNLIANGIKFRKKDTNPVIRITAEETDSSWKFSFADNGIGIDKQYSDKIFVIFQRLHTRKEYEGSGIGLAHCKKIVELHKGKIWVESVQGQGSIFYFTINKNNT